VPAQENAHEKDDEGNRERDERVNFNSF